MPTKKKAKKSVRVYMLTTTGEGDTYITLVDKESWDWIFSGYHPGNAKSSGYEDKTCPPAVLKRWRKANALGLKAFGQALENDEDQFPLITSGSHENDRALQVQPVYGKIFFSTKNAIHYILKHKLKVIDSWEGYVY